MIYQKFLQQMVIVVLFLLFVSGCVTTQPTPDRVATGVAEAKAIAATLTVGAAAVKPAPSPTEILDRFTTQTPVLPVITLTPSAFRPEELVQGNGYGIRVISVETTDSFKSYDRTGLPMPLYPDPGDVFYKVTVGLFKNGVLLFNDDEVHDEVHKLIVVDSTSRAYTVADDQHWVWEGYIDTSKSKPEFITTSWVLYFSIPPSATGLKLQYRDLPLIDLSIK